jgi:DNA-binding transcriptional LysR family regulator
MAMNDPVLVRAGRGMALTPFAMGIGARVRALLDEIDELRSDTEGTPSTWHRSFSVRINDALTPVLAPRLTRMVAAEAPSVHLRFVGQDSKSVDRLRDGSLDLDVGVADPSPSDVRTAVLFADVFVAVVAASSALGRKRSITVEDLCSVPHVSASRRGLDHGPLDTALLGSGHSRRVVAVVPSYAVGALMALEDDLLCLVPSRLASHLQDRGVPIRAHQVPVALPTATVEQRWHQRVDADPASRWLRMMMTSAVSTLPLPR